MSEKLLKVGDLLVQVSTGFAATITAVDVENCYFREYGKETPSEVLSVAEVFRNIDSGTFRHYPVKVV